MQLPDLLESQSLSDYILTTVKPHIIKFSRWSWVQNRSPDFYTAITSQLPDAIQSKPREAFNLILFGDILCRTCNKPFKDTNKTFDVTVSDNYPTYCSHHCTSIAGAKASKLSFKNKTLAEIQDISDRRKSTRLKRYGVEHSLQSDAIQRKKDKTMLKRHGVKHAVHSKKLEAKRHKTNLRKYGVQETFSSSIVQDHIRLSHNTNLGVDYPMQNLEVRQKLKDTLMDRYGVNNQGSVHHPIYSVDNHPLSLKDTFDDVTTVVDMDLLIATYNIKKAMVYSAFKRHNETQYNYFMQVNGFNNPKRSIPETELFHWVKSILPLGTVVHHNYTKWHPDKLRFNYELDIYIPSLNLAIEFNGITYHSDYNVFNGLFDDSDTPKYRHVLKSKEAMEHLNCHVIHIWDDEWLHDESQVKNMLRHRLVNRKDKVYARKTKVIPVKFQQSSKFLYEYHGQAGRKPYSLYYGIEYDNVLIAVMAFNKIKNREWELARFASSVPVIGGFSKLLSRFKQDHPDQPIISFLDMSKFNPNSNVYLSHGFTEVEKGPPSYHYVFNKRKVHKFNLRKGKLKELIGVDVDPSLTENELRKILGIPRIWDCGLVKYRLQPT